MKAKYTHGGYPISDKWVWDENTWKKLGEILYLITTGTKDQAIKADFAYYELKRHFVAEEFEAGVDKLDSYRKDKGFIPLREMLRKIWANGLGKYAHTPIKENFEFASLPKIDLKQEVPEIKVEQMSLF